MNIGKPSTYSESTVHSLQSENMSQPTESVVSTSSAERDSVSGEFVDMDGERFYVIHNSDKLAPFFISIVSDSDHWLFVSSYGGLTAGRVSPDTALFPYITVDKIHDSAVHTGCKTILHVQLNGKHYEWEPFNMEHDGLYDVRRNIYKNVPGNKLCFEEINNDLELSYRYTWETSDSFGFIRRCELVNRGQSAVSINLIDGFQNILPAGTPRFLQERSSNLVDAYKWTELDTDTGVALFTLNSGITDRAEPFESLRANTVFCLGLNDHRTLICSEQLDSFRRGEVLHQEQHKRGVRGAYLVNKTFELAAGSVCHWMFAANIEQTQSQVLSLMKKLSNADQVADDISRSVASGTDRLCRIMASCDGLQLVNEENVAVHHYANTLFNVLRGGVFHDQYRISSADFLRNVKHFNKPVFERHRNVLDQLPASLSYISLMAMIRQQGDAQLERICLEYLPITFGRRHGDPSRPWNVFEIRTRDADGKPLLFYEGNWRDIFQNWEALLLSYPEFIESVIAKFVNASTIDGYNPYRITKHGIDWEVDDPDDPWSYIGYWGDHQIIYLLKLLEQSADFHPERLVNLLREQLFSYANVPYRIKPLESLLNDAKSTVVYDDTAAETIEQRVAEMGADGRLLLDPDGRVYLVNLLEKLLVPLLSKAGNLVVDGGIWLNTQRPEWNDANNALVGQGLSMVTLYYMRRYVSFMRTLLADDDESFSLSKDVSIWLLETSDAMSLIRDNIQASGFDANDRYQALLKLGQSASDYRKRVYAYALDGIAGTVEQSTEVVKFLLDDMLFVIDDSIRKNLRDDGLYHAYNLISIGADSVEVKHLYPMLEGQVALLSSGAISPQQAVSVIDALFNSDMFRDDLHTFMLYPDRQLPGFLQKNRIPENAIKDIPIVKSMREKSDHRLIVRDEEGVFRFNADMTNIGAVDELLDRLENDYDEISAADREALKQVYEDVFNHRQFTGRSGGMFGFEGLGCVYWHMVSKLLLAVQENFYRALDTEADEQTCHKIGQLYYRVREGIGFNKSPAEYGAFPTDPYSHTPGHAGAQQPGMTGQVKEELITRFGELGARVRNGEIHFAPRLLHRREFIADDREFRYLDVMNEWRSITIPANALCYTWCQLPVIYQLDDSSQGAVSIEWRDGTVTEQDNLVLSAKDSAEIFGRTGNIRGLRLMINSGMLFDD